MSCVLGASGQRRERLALRFRWSRRRGGPATAALLHAVGQSTCQSMEARGSPDEGAGRRLRAAMCLQIPRFASLRRRAKWADDGEAYSVPVIVTALRPRQPRRLQQVVTCVRARQQY